MRIFFSLVLAAVLATPLFAQAEKNPALTSFNAVPRGKQVLLSWNSDVQGVQTYALEKSKNGTEFVAFGNVQGADAMTEFLETDFTPYTGLSYYRLSLTMKDGTVSYSNVVPVKYNDQGDPVSPVAGATNVSKEDHGLLVIVRDNNGEEYYSKVEITENGDPVICSDPDPALNQGTYTIIGCSDQVYYAKQMVVK